uniref:Uncharacterized protein n=1 Tax=Oryza sativa subsp. japonica TaxID=39947 RepID=Q2QQ16_ORYSJ|nr:hypothetical protein LOC_Os12g32560 [Oryza sativa Japonica Group]
MAPHVTITLPSSLSHANSPLRQEQGRPEQAGRHTGEVDRRAEHRWRVEQTSGAERAKRRRTKSASRRSRRRQAKPVGGRSAGGERHTNLGFGRNISRKGAPHGIPYDLHGLGRSSLLTLAREGLVGGIPQRAFGRTCRNRKLGQQAQTGGERRRSKRKTPRTKAMAWEYTCFADQGPCQGVTWAKMVRRPEGMGFAKYQITP